MGWYTIAAPGTEAGPCAEPCQHTDCAATRRDAGPCRLCGEPVGYETPMMYVRSPRSDDGARTAHARCVYKKYEKQDTHDVG